MQLLFMLMHTAEFEYKLKQLLKQLLVDRSSKWDACKKEASERMSELSEYFSGAYSGCAAQPGIKTMGSQGTNH